MSPVRPAQEEFAGPLWTLGSTWYAPLADGRCIVTRAAGLAAALEPDGTLHDLDLPYTSFQASLHADGTQVVAIGASTTAAPTVVLVSPDGAHEVVHESASAQEDSTRLPAFRRRGSWLSSGEEHRGGPGGRKVFLRTGPRVRPTGCAAADAGRAGVTDVRR